MIKKTILMVAVVIAVTATSATAQKFYVKLGGGYSFGAGKASNIEGLGYDYSYDGTTRTTTEVPFSLGKGVNLDLGVGYMFNEYIGLELGARNLFGLSNEFKDNNSSGGYTDNTTTKVSYSSLALIPALKVVAPLGETFSLYSRIGISLPLTGKATRETSETDNYGGSTTTRESEAEVTSYFKLGYAAAFGVNIALSQNFSLFGEISALAASFTTKEGTLTKYNVNGQDQLSGMDIHDKKTEYKKEYTSGGSNDPNTPDQDVAFTLPASSVGLTVGIQISF
jgi:opacity protein-like surface antigen